MTNEKKPFNLDKKKVLASLILILTITMIIVYCESNLQAIPITKNETQFTISSWAFPDEYGQGIEGFEVFENSTGAWVPVGGYEGYQEKLVYDWESNGSIKLRCWTWLNSTFMDVATTNEGKALQRHSVIVTNSVGTIFSQQNFTWFYDDDTIDPPLWFYGYEVVLNFLPLEGQVYTATVTYQLFY